MKLNREAVRRVGVIEDLFIDLGAFQVGLAFIENVGEGIRIVAANNLKSAGTSRKPWKKDGLKNPFPLIRA